MPLETGSQIVSDKGNPALAVGTAGTESTNAPIGVLDFGSPNQNGFDTLNKLYLIKQKEAFDLDQKQRVDTFNKLKALDLSTGALLDNDKKELVDNVVPKITNYLLAHPHAINPTTQEDIKYNIEYNKMLDDFNTKKAQAQTRYALQKDIEDEISKAPPSQKQELIDWYQKQKDVPFGFIKPSQKVYSFDFSKLGKNNEIITNDKIDINNPIQTKFSVETNLNTALNEGKAEYNTNPDFKQYVSDLYQSQIDVEKARIAKEQAAIANINATITDPTQKANALKLLQSKSQPFIASEINVYDNYATDFNKAQIAVDPHTKNLLPIYDATKIPTEEQFRDILVANKVVKQTKLEQTDKENPVWETALKLKQAQERIDKKGGASAGTQDYLLQAVSPFIKPTAEELYNSGLSNAKVKTLKEQGVFYNPDNLTGSKTPDTIETKVVVTPDGRNLAKYNGILVEYKDGEWKKADDNLSVDERIAQKLKGNIDSVVRKGKELEINYTVVENKVAVPKTITMDRATYLRDLAKDNADFTSTENELESYGIYDLNDDTQFNKAVELATTGKITGQTPDAKKTVPTTTNKNYTLKGKTYTSEQIHYKAQQSGVSDEDYIKQIGLQPQ